MTAATSTPLEELGEIDLSSLEIRVASPNRQRPEGIGLGDKVVLVFSDDQKRISARLLEGGNDLAKGRLAIVSPLGKAIIGAEGKAMDEFCRGERRRYRVPAAEKGWNVILYRYSAGEYLHAIA